MAMGFYFLHQSDRPDSPSETECLVLMGAQLRHGEKQAAPSKAANRG